MTLRILILVLLLALAGCAAAPQHAASAPVRTETVEVPRYIQQPVAAELTAPIVVLKPAADCNDGTSAVWCNGALAKYRQALESAVQSCNDDRAAIRAGTPGGTPIGKDPGG